MKDTTPTKDQLRAALERLTAAVGETQHDWPTQELRKAYDAAHDLLHPEEAAERDRFMGRDACVPLQGLR